MPDIRITPGSGIMAFTSSLNFRETLTQNASGSLVLQGSGSSNRTNLFAIDGNNGRLFSVDDDLSDSLFSVNTIAGLPVIEAFADNTVKIGPYGNENIIVSGSTTYFSDSIILSNMGTENIGSSVYISPYSFSQTYSDSNSFASSNFASYGASGLSNSGFWSINRNNISAQRYGGPTFEYNSYSGNGDLYIGGVLYQNQYSDIIFKDNVTPIENALEKVKAIGGVEFDWNDYAKEQSGREGRDVGVIANVVKEVYPLAVRDYDREDIDRIVSHLVVDYDKLNPLALQAIKELANIVEELKVEIEILKSK